MNKLAIIIPARNESQRISKTLERYGSFFSSPEIVTELSARIIVVLNACTDNTAEIVQSYRKKYPLIELVNLIEGGKGLALAHGFAHALRGNYDFIGSLDADMSMDAAEYHRLLSRIGNADGVIGSRYMRGSVVTPKRPWIKTYGRKLIYNNLVWALLGIRYNDLQCGEKIYRRAVLTTILPELTVRGWAIDAEILYRARAHGFKIIEAPVTWEDRTGSKLSILDSGLSFITSIFKIRMHHSWLNRFTHAQPIIMKSTAR